MRRSRLVPNAHFSFVTPLALPFPYDLGIGETTKQDRIELTERALCRYEPQVDGQPPGRIDSSFPSARLLGISPLTHAQCLPHLDIGDSHSWVLRTSGVANTYSSGPKTDAQGPPSMSIDNGDSADARRAFSDWVSGRAVRIEFAGYPEGTGTAFINSEGSFTATQATSPGYGPWALRYGGYQFGSWADQLGDGRTISLLETINPESCERVEVQIKGGGRTPYSRFGDGLATVKSSMREFLASEYMAALNIPTSRSLCVTSLPDVVVEREVPTPAGINMRLARSWLRVGSFEIHSHHQEWESLRMLGEYISRHIFGWEDVVVGESDAPRTPWALRLTNQVATSNAITVARWQVYGFMHGVMNTDNIAVTGDTIDYGPYGFMDLFDEDRICNHSDFTGRYSYRMQPAMALFAIDKLFDALSPIIGFEMVHGRAPAPGELKQASGKALAEWVDVADEKRDEVATMLKNTMLDEWEAGWAARLGLRKADKILITSLLDAITSLDMPRFLRGLCNVPEEIAKGEALDRVAQRLIEYSSQSQTADIPRIELLSKWLITYAELLRKENRDAVQLGKEMRQKNPRFVLRNWITDEVAERLEKNDTAFLEHVRDMCSRPFDDWEQDEVCLSLSLTSAYVQLEIHSHPTCHHAPRSLDKIIAAAKRKVIHFLEATAEFPLFFRPRVLVCASEVGRTAAYRR